MPIYKKKRKSPLANFTTLLAPERIVEAYQRVGEYFEAHHGLRFDTPEGTTNVLQELIRDHGEPMRRALTSVFCEEKGPQIPSSEDLQVVLSELVPAVNRRYSLPQAVALLLATLMLKAHAAGGDKAVREELTRENLKAARQEKGSPSGPAKSRR